MPLVDDQLRRRLPPRYSQEADPEPWVYCKFALLGTARAWYVIKGEPCGEDVLFFGFVAERAEFDEFRLSELEAIRGSFDSRLEFDQTFTEGRLTDVVPAPDS